MEARQGREGESFPVLALRLSRPRTESTPGHISGPWGAVTGRCLTIIPPCLLRVERRLGLRNYGGTDMVFGP